MKTLLVSILVLLITRSAFAHRLDEYLQASTFSVDRDHIQVHMRLTPGVGVIDKVLKAIDSNGANGANGDGVISETKQRDYVEKVRRDISLTLDKNPLQLRVVGFSYPGVDEMKQGMGEILIDFQSDIPAGGGPDRAMVFENHHQPAISVYLMNCLVPRDSAIRIVSQNRNFNQSFYQLDYTQSQAAPNASWASRTGSASLFKAFFFHGVHHILTGYDHLLFVSALVLAATSLWDLFKVVSAFTIAHTITLTLAALSLIHLSEHIVEPLISASIVFVALQNVLMPKRAPRLEPTGRGIFLRAVSRAWICRRSAGWHARITGRYDVSRNCCIQHRSGNRASNGGDPVVRVIKNGPKNPARYGEAHPPVDGFSTHRISGYLIGGDVLPGYRADLSSGISPTEMSHRWTQINADKKGI